MRAPRLALGMLLLVLACPARSVFAEPPLDPQFRLQDPQGTWHALEDAKESKLVVIAFLGVDCPIAEQYAPRLSEMAQAFEPKGVAFFAVDSNRLDDLASMESFAKSNGFPFPFLKDPGNRFADAFKIERSPEVVLLDRGRNVRYQGRIDDQYGLGEHRPSPTRRDLAEAIEELLKGGDVTVPRTEASGCKIGRSKLAGNGPITYAKQVASLLNARCVTCHRDGEIAPFRLDSYEQAAGRAEMIAEVVREGRMPPWHADSKYGKFQNEARLTDAEKTLIAAWTADGAPQGDPAETPPPPEFAEGWRIPKPDLIVEMPEAVEIPATGVFPYQNILVDPKLDRDVWVRASQVRPGNPAVVHHVVVTVQAPDKPADEPLGLDFLAAYSPGMPPRTFPEGLAKFVPAGSKLMIQLHYTPRGKIETDRSIIGLTFADPSTVKKRMTSVAIINANFQIPPESADFAEKAEHRFNQDYILYSLMPHMHLRGKSFRFEATYPDGRKEILLDVPRYEFEWQNIYVLETPKPMPEGTVLTCFAHFDNSADNPNNPDPSRTVTFGEQTDQEMLVGYVDAALDYQDLKVGPPKVARRDDGKFDVTFRHRPPAGTKTVHLAATFNKDFSPVQELQGPDADGLFTTTIPLEPGTYEYKYVHDRQGYRHDPANWRQVGFFNNSLLKVGDVP